MQFAASIVRQLRLSRMITVAFVPCMGLAAVARAQTVTFTDLYTLGTPTGFSSPNAQMVANGDAVGSGVITATGDGHAFMWTASSGTAIDLNPAGFTDSQALAIDGNQQAGAADGTMTGNNVHAILWSGSAASYVDLNPAGFTNSIARALSGGQQVGDGSRTGSSRTPCFGWARPRATSI